MIYQLFPRSTGMTDELLAVINCFKHVSTIIDSNSNELHSNEVLSFLRIGLEKIDYSVEVNKSNEGKIMIPVLFGLNNEINKEFFADAVSADGRIVIEVEAGRAVVNNQFLKDIFQACMMYCVEYLVLAIRQKYKTRNDFNIVYNFLETLYISNRLQLPLKGILLIGY